MIFTTIPSVSESNAKTFLAEGFRGSAMMSIGGFSLVRSKRQGRNPSTGARTSRKYGLAMIFDTGIPSMANFDGSPII